MFLAIFGIMFGSFGVSTAFQSVPDVGKSQNSAREIFCILDKEPSIKNKVIKFYDFL